MSAATVATKREIDQDSPSVRSCEFCGSCTTPTWRRGPSGKGSLCNACGIKWRLKKRTAPISSSNKKDNDHSSSSSTNNKKAKSKKLYASPIPTISKKSANSSPSTKSVDRKAPATTTSNTSSNNNGQQQQTQLTNNKERPAINPDSNDKRYYCKFCDKTFASTHFKNSQQFGAHCSNCSRRPARGITTNDAPSSPHYDDEEDDTYSADEMNVDMESELLEEDSHYQQQQPSPQQQQQHHADDLLNHLLHVVANQLVEENELISIRGELAAIKEDMHQQKEHQQSSIAELRTQLHRDVEEISAMIAEDARQKQRVAAAQLCELDQYWREMHNSLESHLYSTHSSVLSPPSSPSSPMHHLHQLSA